MATPTILHITNDFTDEVGGIARHVDELTRRLVNHAEVHVAYLCRQGEPGIVEDEGRFIARIPRPGGKLVRTMSNLVAGVGEFVDRVEPDVIHVHTPIEALTLSLPASIPTVYTQHSSVLDRWLEVPGLRAITRLRLRRFSTVIAVSRSVATKLDLPQSMVIPNGVAASWSGVERREASVARANLFEKLGAPDPGGRLVVFVGRLVENKGLEPFLLTNAEFLRRYSGQLTLVVAGEGARRSSIESIVSRSHLTNVLLLGEVPPQMIEEVYAAGEFCVIPSRREPFGIVAVEAMACGCLPVVSQIGGLPEIVTDGVDGFHFSADLSLQTVLQRAGESDLLRMRDAAVKTAVQRFSWESIAERTFDEYRRLLPGSGDELRSHDEER